MKMHCFCCDGSKEFSPNEEGLCCDCCGHYQDSEPAGALEICEMATWHDLNSYRETAMIAESGGFTVSSTPRYFLPL